MNIEIYSEKFFEDIKHITEDGIEYWLARELQEILGYKEWRNFLRVIEKAKASVETTDIGIPDHFVDVNKRSIWNGARRKLFQILCLQDMLVTLLYKTETQEKK